MNKLKNYFGHQNSAPPVWLAVLLVLAFALAAFIYTLNIPSPGGEIVLAQDGSTAPAQAATSTTTAQAQLIATVDSLRTATASANADKTATKQAGLTATAQANKSATARAIENATAFSGPFENATAYADALAKARITATAQKKLIATVDSLRTATAFAGLPNADKTATKQAGLTATAQAATSTQPIAATSTQPIAGASEADASGSAPVVLTDSDGAAYAVFAPVEDSEFTGIEGPNTGGTSPAPLALLMMLVLGAILVSAPLVLRRRWTTRNVVR